MVLGVDRKAQDVKDQENNWVWWHTPETLAVGRGRWGQEEVQSHLLSHREFKVSLGQMRPAQKKKKKRKKKKLSKNKDGEGKRGEGGK